MDNTTDLDLLYTQQQTPATPPPPDVDLLFRELSPPGGESYPLELLFADDDDAPAPEIPPVTVEAAGGITGIRASVLVRSVVLVQSARTSITGLRQSVGVAYSANVSRPMVAKSLVQYQRARSVQIGTAERYQQAQPTNTGARTYWQPASIVQGGLRAAWQEAGRLATCAVAVYQQALAVPTRPLQQAWQESGRLRTSAAAQFEQALRLPTLGARQRYQETVRLRTAASQAWQAAAPARISVEHLAGYALQAGVMLGGLYQDAWPPRPGARPRPVVPVDPCYLPT